jgi:hypothetical protein
MTALCGTKLTVAFCSLGFGFSLRRPVVPKAQISSTINGYRSVKITFAFCGLSSGEKVLSLNSVTISVE